MSQSFYPQSEFNTRTPKTVGEIVQELLKLPQDLPLVFQSPLTGAYGPQQYYTVDSVAVEDMPAYDYNCGKQEHYDEDTDTVTVDEEDYIQHFLAWKGVVVR